MIFLIFNALKQLMECPQTKKNKRRPTRRSTRAGIGFKPLNMVHTRPGHLWRWADELHDKDTATSDYTDCANVLSSGQTKR
jgi:hypothetical protein